MAREQSGLQFSPLAINLIANDAAYSLHGEHYANHRFVTPVSILGRTLWDSLVYQMILLMFLMVSYSVGEDGRSRAEQLHLILRQRKRGCLAADSNDDLRQITHGRKFDFGQVWAEGLSRLVVLDSSGRVAALRLCGGSSRTGSGFRSGLKWAEGGIAFTFGGSIFANIRISTYKYFHQFLFSSGSDMLCTKESAI
ncbi:hypothetical protein OROGR_020924 [Orobanche gracilis]